MADQPRPPSFPPPPAGYYPPPPGPDPEYGGNPVVVVSQPVSVPIFRESPVSIRCQHCNADVVTCVKPKSGMLVYLLCCCLCWCGFFLGCCLIPFCIPSCKDYRHMCPNCNREIARFDRL